MTIDPDLRDQLISKARALAEERGWTWREPIEIAASSEEGEAVWILRSNSLMRGQNARIVLRQADHSLVRAGYLSR
jgi:hypothetical protein